MTPPINAGFDDDSTLRGLLNKSYNDKQGMIILDSNMVMGGTFAKQENFPARSKKRLRKQGFFGQDQKGPQKNNFVTPNSSD